MKLRLYEVRRWRSDGREFVVMEIGHWPNSVARGEYADRSDVWATVEWMEKASEVIR